MEALQWLRPFDAFHGHRGVVGIDDLQRASARAARAVFQIHDHVTILQDGLSNG